MQLRTPITGLTRASPYRPVGDTFVWWDLSNRTHPLGNIVEFHERTLNPNDLDLAWRKHAIVSVARVADAPAIKRKLTRSPLPAQEQNATPISLFSRP